MPDLSFSVTKARAVAFAAAPLIEFQLAISNGTPERIHTVVLRCQIQLEVTRRRYTSTEQDLLVDLFGEPDRWSRTLRSMLWTHASLVVPAFTASTTAGLQVPCTFDFNVAATKYFNGLQDGDIPLCFLFSGTVFYAEEDGALQATPISWDKEATFRLPVQVWKEMMEQHYPNSAWLRLRRDAFERLYRYKVSRGLATWEEAIAAVVPEAKEAVET